MLKRSPVLGYNHNVRHRGVVFHVQTEDSGIDNPHLFTHMFHGGTILGSRRLDYDPGAAEEVVKSLMQSQHKAMLKDLKGGVFDDKIDRYLVDNAALLASPSASAAPDLLATQEMPILADTSATQEVPLMLDTSATYEATRVEVEPEDSADATVRIDQVQRGGRPRVHDTMPAPTALPPDSPAVAVTMPATAVAPMASSRPPPTRPGSQTMGLGSAMLGGPATPAPTHVAADRQPLPAPPANDAAAAARSAPPQAQRERLEPGRLEFRPPTGDYARPRPADLSTLMPRVEFHKPPKSTDAELSAAFQAIRIGEPDAATKEAPPGDSAASPAARREHDAPHVYLHTRSGRHSASPDPIEDDPTQRQEQIPTMKRSARGAPPQAPAGSSPPVAKHRPPPTRAELARADVMVSKPSVIVGAPPKMVGAPSRPADAKPAPRRAREGGRAGLFGKDLISEKSLDEVILAYLSEDGEEK